MKTRVLNLIICAIALMSCMSISAQKYICLQNDVDAKGVSDGKLNEEVLKMYQNSTIEMKDELKVPGDSLSVCYQVEIGGREYLIPKDNCKEVNLPSEESEIFKQLFKYDRVNSYVVYKPSPDDELPEGAKLIVDDNEVFTDIKEDLFISVQDGSTLRLILSSDSTYYLDEVFTTDSLDIIAKSEDSDGLDWKKILLYVLLGLLGIAILGGIYYFFFSGEEDDEEDDEGRPNKKDGKHQHPTPQTAYVEGKGLNNQFDQIQNSLNKIESSVASISSRLTDNRETDRLKNEIAQLKSNLSQRENDLKSRNETIKNKELEIQQQKNSINTLTQQNASLANQLEDAVRLEKGTLMVPNAKAFVQNAGRILSVCREGEEVIKSFISSLSGKEQTQMSYFLASYIKEMSSKGRDQWNGIVSTLGIKGYINDPDITRYLQNERSQQEWLRKHFIEDFLQSYISPLIIMLEQIRCAKQFGIFSPTPTNIEQIIREIVDANKAYDIVVKYIPLYAPISSDDKERLIDEISSELPKELETIVSVVEDVPLFLSHIGVVAEGVRSDKTICVVK